MPTTVLDIETISSSGISSSIASSCVDLSSSMARVAVELDPALGSFLFLGLSRFALVAEGVLDGTSAGLTRLNANAILILCWSTLLHKRVI